jgi:hypothetical protein
MIPEGSPHAHGQIARQIGVSREAPLLRVVTLCRPDQSHIARVDPDDLASVSIGRASLIVTTNLPIAIAATGSSVVGRSGDRFVAIPIVRSGRNSRRKQSHPSGRQ